MVMAVDRSLLTFAALAYLLISTLTSAAGFEVGVKAGDWAKYGEVSSSWRTSLQNRTEPLNLSEFRNTEWIRFEIRGVFDNVVEGVLTFHYKDGRERNSTGMGDITLGDLGIYLIPAGLSEGDKFNLSRVPVTLLESSSRVCGGEDREVNYLRINETAPVTLGEAYNLTVVTIVDIYWDRVAGILCEFTSHAALNDLENRTVEEAAMSLKMTETNIWGPGLVETTTTSTTSTTVATDLTLNLLIGAAVVVVLIGIFMYRRRRRRPEEAGEDQPVSSE